MAQLTELQRYKEQLARNVFNTLHGRLGTQLSEKLRHHVNTAVKRKVKIHPNPDRPQRHH